MHVTVDEPKLVALLDALLERWQAKPKRFPFQKRDAIIPQTIVPDALRRDKVALSLFYFYTCIYMRGGIESLQAFNALLKIRTNHPELFDPYQAQWLTQQQVEPILKKYIGWDSVAASKNWVENSRRLMQSWGGNPLNLVKKLSDYDEALRRIKNKLGKGERRRAGEDGHGFRGFQPKMVSMFIYFMDWEGLLKPRFFYPPPADFHNFRLGLSHGALVVTPTPMDIRTAEKLSKPWRDATLRYIVERNADPIEVADALWMFSLIMCGNSPLVSIRDADRNGSGMFAHEDLPHFMGPAFYLAPRFRKALELTCLRCPVSETCTLSIPSRPYYRKGLLLLTPRFKVEEYLERIHPDTRVVGGDESEAATTLQLLPDG